MTEPTSLLVAIAVGVIIFLILTGEARAENHRLRVQVMELTVKVEQLEQRNLVLHEALSALQCELADARSELTRATVRHDELKQMLDLLQQELMRYRGQFGGGLQNSPL